jgi:hypothetical protein
MLMDMFLLREHFRSGHPAYRSGTPKVMQKHISKPVQYGTALTIAIIRAP